MTNVTPECPTGQAISRESPLSALRRLAGLDAACDLLVRFEVLEQPPGAPLRHTLLEAFDQFGPYYPLCGTAALGHRDTARRTRAHALTFPNIQPCVPGLEHMVVVDIDREDAATYWQRTGWGPPTYVVINMESGRAHYIYVIEQPVRSSPKARALLGYIREAFRIQGADPGYRGPTCKNPGHPAWLTLACPVRYSLTELWSMFPADVQELARNRCLEPRAAPPSIDSISTPIHTGEKRDRLFAGVREFALQIIREPGITVEDFTSRCMDAGRLMAREMKIRAGKWKDVIRRVGRWVWTHGYRSKPKEGIVGKRRLDIPDDLVGRERQQAAGFIVSQERHQATAERVRVATLQVLEHAGNVSAASFRAVARAAGLAASSISRRYQDVVRQVCDAWLLRGVDTASLHQGDLPGEDRMLQGSDAEMPEELPNSIPSRERSDAPVWRSVSDSSGRLLGAPSQTAQNFVRHSPETPMTDPKPFTIPAGTLKRGTVLRLEATATPRVVFDFGKPYAGTSGKMVHFGVWPVVAPQPTRFQRAIEFRARLDVAQQMIITALDLACLIAPPDPGVDRRADIRGMQSANMDAIDRHLALLLRPVCSLCGWPWDDAPECEGCGEGRAPDGRSVPTCDAMQAAGSDEEWEMILAVAARLIKEGLIP